MNIRNFTKLKGNDDLETAENYSILAIFVGAMIFSIGVGLNILSTHGISAILAMIGAVVSFLSTMALIVVWVMKEMKKEPIETK